MFRIVNKQVQKQIAVQLNDKPLPAIQTLGRIKYFKLQQIKVNMPQTVWIDQQGNRYEGQLNIPQKSGHGIVSFTNGGKFEGHWINYKREGYGVQYSSHGEIYSGEWVNDKKEGYGVMNHYDGDIYQGEWKNGSKCGKGCMIYHNGDLYQGQWKNSRCQGFGIFKWIDGDIYQGEFKYGEKDGFGIYKDVFGRIYQGQYHWESRFQKVEDIRQMLHVKKSDPQSANQFHEIQKYAEQYWKASEQIIISLAQKI